MPLVDFFGLRSRKERSRARGNSEVGRGLPRFLLGSSALLLVAIVVLYSIASRFDGDVVGADAVAALMSATGHQWMLSNPAQFEPGLRPTVVLKDLRLPNAEWGARASLVSIARVEVQGDWISLISGHPTIVTLVFEGVQVNLQTNRDGIGNWTIPTSVREQSTPGSATTLHQISSIEAISFKDTQVRFHSGWGDEEQVYPPIDQIELRSFDADSPVTIALNTRINEQRLSVAGELGSPAAMFGNNAFAITLDGQYAGRESDAEMRVVGRVSALKDLHDLHLEFSLKADSLNDVGSISGFELPRDTPVSIRIVAANDGAGPVLQDYVLRIGQAIIRPQSL